MLRLLNSGSILTTSKRRKKKAKVIDSKYFFKGCDQFLSYMISKLPESPHKHLKYAHYHNLVYKSIFGLDAKGLRSKRGKSKKDLMSDIMNDLELMLCGRAFVDLANSISFGDTYQESKEFINKRYGEILGKE